MNEIMTEEFKVAARAFIESNHKLLHPEPIPKELIMQKHPKSLIPVNRHQKRKQKKLGVYYNG